MKKTFIILHLFIVSVFVFNQISIKFCTTQPLVCISCMFDAFSQNEDNSAEDLLLNTNEGILPFSAFVSLIGTFQFHLIPGILPPVWQPPE